MPTFDSTDKEIEQSLAKHALLLKKQMEQEQRTRAVSGGDIESWSLQPIFTGTTGEDSTREAIKQIEQTFALSSKIKVGTAKLD